MSATNRAVQFPVVPAADSAAEANFSSAAPQTANGRVPQLRVMPIHTGPQPHRFARVPTHAVSVHRDREQREHPRASLKLPLRLRSVDGIAEPFPVTLVTRDISSTGVFFLCPRSLALGTTVELEIVLVSKPMGRGNVVMVSLARVCRAEPAAMPGWFGVAASFAQLEFDRDDGLPSRFLNR
ncbi:MAG: PilZ domain-containing protein [Acidobacteriia bacterium]|nr:PilZ domain-containing protein [Terriglobia bacterium]